MLTRGYPARPGPLGLGVLRPGRRAELAELADDMVVVAVEADVRLVLLTWTCSACWPSNTRGSAIGMTVTGLIIGGAAYFWQKILGFFVGLSRSAAGITYLIWLLGVAAEQWL